MFRRTSIAQRFRHRRTRPSSRNTAPNTARCRRIIRKPITRPPCGSTRRWRSSKASIRGRPTSSKRWQASRSIRRVARSSSIWQPRAQSRTSMSRKSRRRRCSATTTTNSGTRWSRPTTTSAHIGNTTQRSSERSRPTTAIFRPANSANRPSAPALAVAPKRGKTWPDMDEIVWRGMTRAQLDAAYNNSAAVKNSGEKLADWQRRSDVVRARQTELLDLRYGPRPRNRIDAFRCGRQRAPLLVYIHGGYWQRNAKEFYACLAEGPLARGIDVALIGYTLAPDASLTEIVAEARAGVRWLRAQGPGL